MSMAKGLLPDTHAQSASAARSYVLAEADVVMLIGARLNWLLSHGKGKTWGGATRRAERSSSRSTSRRPRSTATCAIDAPLIGDIGSCVAALLAGIGANWAKPPRRVDRRDRRAQGQEPRQDGRDAGEEPVADELPQRAERDPRHRQGATRTRSSSTKAPTRSTSRARIVDMYEPRKRLDVGTWGIMGIGMGFAVAAAVTTGKPVIAIEGDSAFGFSGMEVETICRYNLPVCVVVFNNNGVYKGTDVNPTRRPTWRRRCSSRTRATTS